jgi:hypothetical protein
MTQRFVSPFIFQLYALLENWSSEHLNRRNDLYGPVRRLEDAPNEQAVLHLRWLLHPALGLPLEPFVISTIPRIAALTTPEEYAAEDGWEVVEVVGLPVDDSWATSGYPTTEQGMRDSPMPPIDAALERLAAGAPIDGWSSITDRGDTLPSWEPPDPAGLLFEGVIAGLLPGVQQMLEFQPALTPQQHKDFRPPKRPYTLPRQLGYQGNLVLADRPATIETAPWPMVLMAAASDPFASLALGFGTLLRYDPHLVYMVTVFHSFYDVEYAAVIIDPPRSPRPEAPRRVQAVTLAHNRPAHTDQGYSNAVDVRWERSQHIGLVPDPNRTPLSYAVGRVGPFNRFEILLSRRPQNIGGWTPYAAAAAQRPDPFAHFTEGRLDIGIRPLPRSCVYSVAAQDLFGRWGSWNSADYNLPVDPLLIPKIVQLKLDSASKLTADFSWDWADRSPEFIELSGRFSTPPGTEVLRVRINFAGAAQGQVVQGTATLSPLDPQRRFLAGSWGSPQDEDPDEPGVRYYRLEAHVPVSFTQKELIFDLIARGQDHLHQKFIPGLGISAWSAPAQARLLDPTPPPAPVPEAPQWASLPDVTGASRAKLTWPGSPGLQYFVYTASETALLQAAKLPGPDYSLPFSERLDTLRGLLNQRELRRVFRRLQDTPLEKPEYEAELPHGSRILHVFAVLAVNDRKVESDWPGNPDHFMAVAAPRLAPPGEPALQVEVDELGQVSLKVQVRAGPAAERVELYRTSSETLAKDVDLMGKPIASLPVNGAGEVAFSEHLTPSWRRVSYRAVAWSVDDNLLGLVGARSSASPASPVFLPPAAPPNLEDLRVNEPGSTASEILVSVRSAAPVENTPLGPHHLIMEAMGLAGGPDVRQEGDLSALPGAADRSQVPTPGAGPRPLVRVPGTGRPPFRYYTWISRPAANQDFNLTVKLLDPLGQISSLQANVPVLEQLPAPVIGQLSAQVFSQFGLGSIIGVRFQVLSTIWPGREGEYTLSLLARGPFLFLGGPPARGQAKINAIPTAQDDQQAGIMLRQALQNPMVRAAFVRIGAPLDPPYTYAAWIRRGTPSIIMVALVDPLGQIGRGFTNVSGS